MLMPLALKAFHNTLNGRCSIVIRATFYYQVVYAHHFRIFRIIESAIKSLRVELASISIIGEIFYLIFQSLTIKAPNIKLID